MHPQPPLPLVEAYLVVENPRTRLSHWIAALAELDATTAPPVASVGAHYDPVTDEALVVLRYDEVALGPTRLDFMIDIALLAEIGMIQPLELDPGARRRFLTERIGRCTHYVDDRRSVAQALTELVRAVRDRKTAAPRTTVVGALPLRAPAPTIPPRAIPIPQPPAIIHNKPSMRDEAPLLGRGTRNNVPRSTRNEISRVEIVSARGSEQRAPEARPTLVALPPAAYASLPSGRMTRARSPSQHGTEPYLPAVELGSGPETIYARYLRGGRWVPVRIGSLSLKGAALLTGALPRLHDNVDIALTFGPLRALVRGAVGKVSTLTESTQTGAATFSVTFQLDDVARRQLTALLSGARAAQVMITPPPPRATRRFPVDWPVCLGTARGAVRAEALDVSQHGMFVHPSHALALESNLNFSAVLDDGGAPISGRARVVRQISEVDAKVRGLDAGYGLSIEELAASDAERWLAFLARIERRTARRVLIGASAARLEELQAGLAGAGYAVTGGTDVGAIVQLAASEIRPVDIAVIDAGWLAPGAGASWIESLFSARSVPCLTLHGDVRRARAAVDKLLHVDD